MPSRFATKSTMMEIQQTDIEFLIKPSLFVGFHYQLTPCILSTRHCNDVIMGAMASRITSLTIVNVRGINRWPSNSPHKGPVTREMFPFDDVIMILRCDVIFPAVQQRPILPIYKKLTIHFIATAKHSKTITCAYFREHIISVQTQSPS